jgi:transposase
MRTSRYKIKRIRSHYLNKTTTTLVFAKKIGLSPQTIYAHINQFVEQATTHPEHAWDINFFIPKPKRIPPPNLKYNEMVAVLPELLAKETASKVFTPSLWEAYQKVCPTGYGYSRFRRLFGIWYRAKGICLHAHKRVTIISNDDMEIFEQWLRGINRHEWQRAVVITNSYNSVPLIISASQARLKVETLQRWIAVYNEKGLSELKRKIGFTTGRWHAPRTEKKKNLMKLIHESPQAHGFNRTSWTLADLSAAYYNLYGVNVSVTAVALYFKQEGFAFKKAKVVLTSPDPKFREKLDNVKNILSNLGEKERFFSIDEYGPAAIKMKPGWSYVKADEVKLVKKNQKSKGWFICTAAIELSTNQVTHFYSRTKDTDEMIKLIDILVVEYRTDKKLYMSWDAASWHSSKKLKDHIKTINENANNNLNTTPYVELAPLPSTAQFLNVIESVFSGMAKAVIHNSNYQSVDECKQAINRHFEIRNNHFRNNPQKAGNTIWGKERVKPVFDETHNCKDPLYPG